MDDTYRSLGRIVSILILAFASATAAGPAGAGEVAVRKLLEEAAVDATPPSHLSTIPRRALSAMTADQTAAAALVPGNEFDIVLPRIGKKRFVHERTVRHANGDLTIIAFLKGSSIGFRAIITTGEHGGSGRILTPDGLFLLEARDDHAWVIDTENAELKRRDPTPHDGKYRPSRPDTQERIKSSAQYGSGSFISTSASVAMQGATPNAVVDLMLLHTPAMATHYGAALATRLNFLVELTNQAFLDSGVRITLRLVHTKQVSYSDNINNDVALDAMTYSPETFFTTSERLRYGADLVSLIRRDEASDPTCGVAWQNDSFYIGDPGSNYSAIRDGLACDDYTLAHEIGHNMGNAHDRANSPGPGIFSYSFGYGVDGTFGTIMSYLWPIVGKFSNPDITCSTSPVYACGSPVGLPDEANNALSMNNVAAVVAASVFATHPILDSLIADFGDPYGIWTNSNTMGWTQLHSASARQMVRANLDRSGTDELIVDFGPGYGVWVKSNNVVWAQLHPLSASHLAVADLDGNGVDDVVLDFGANYGVWMWMNNSVWVQLHSLSAQHMAVADMDGNGKQDLVLDFGSPYGLWVRMNNADWTQLHPNTAMAIVAGDIDGNGKDDVIIDFGAPYGIWSRMNNATWAQLHHVSAAHLAVADLDGNGKDDVAIDFGSSYGIWAWMNNGGWTQLHSASSEGMTRVNPGNSAGDALAIDFGPAYGLWLRFSNGMWQQLHALSPASISAAQLNN